MVDFFASQWQQCDAPTDKDDQDGDVVCITACVHVMGHRGR